MITQRSFPRWSLSLLIVAAVLSLPTASAAKSRRPSRPRKLDQRIEAILRQTEARRGFWGIEVLRLSDGKVLYTRNPDHLFQPASNMKLFTTAAAIEKLGPDFVFHTTVESEAGPDAEGRVGDLLLIGRGDPNLSGRVLPYQLKTKWQEPADAVFQSLADQVAAKGVRKVAGNVVADDSTFLFEPYSPDWTEDDLQWGYGAPVTALAFNDNALFLRVRPGAGVGEMGRVWLDPIPDYYKLNTRVETTAAGTKKHISVERVEGSTELDVSGQIPLGASGNEEDDTVAIVNPTQLIGEVFRKALEKRGITVRGSAEVRHFTRLEAGTRRDAAEPSPKPARVVLAEHDSVPLREDIKVINKVSQNLHAEMLLRTLGRELKKDGSLAGGLEVLQEFCAQAAIGRDQTHFADGSGLSREALVTPHAIVRLLKYMASSPRLGSFYDSLPVAGVDGTLADRFHHTPAEGRIHAKTGSIEHVNTLSGYMDLRSGERLAFSILGNSHPLESDDGADIVGRVAVGIFEWFAHRAGKP